MDRNKTMDLKALQKLSYGMYIVCSKNGDRLNGQIANTVFQVTADPPQIAVCINKLNFTHECILSEKAFTLSTIDIDAPMTFIARFGFRSGKEIDKFKEAQYKLSSSGLPIVTENAVATFEADVVNAFDAGTHTIFIGQLKDSQIISDKVPMTYEYYHLIKGGKSPKTAPTYIG